MTHFPLTPMPVRFAHGPPPITSLTFIAETHSTGSATCLAPATILAGDLLLFVDWSVRTSPASIQPKVIPSTFTELSDAVIDTARHWVFSYKIADGSEDGATITGMAVSNFNTAKQCLQFRADRTLTAIGTRQNVQYQPGSGTSTPGGSTPGDPASYVATSLASTPALLLAFYSSAASATPVNPIGFTPSPDSSINLAAASPGAGSSSAEYALAWKFTTTNTNYTIDMADEGSGNAFGSFSFTLG